MADESKHKIPLQVFDTGYTLVPAFWVRLILADEDKNIPASFWKYMMVLWGDIVGINCIEKGFVAKKTMEDFGIRPATAMKWTAALAVSCLFKVDYGYQAKLGEKGVPTRFKYLDGTQEEWELFIRCLAAVIRFDRAHNYDNQDVLGFRLQMAITIAKARHQAGLSPLQTDDVRAWLNQQEKKGYIKLVDKTSLKFDILRQPGSDSRLVRLRPDQTVEESDYGRITAEDVKDR